MIKNILRLSFFSILGLAFLASCAKNNNTATGNNNNNNTYNPTLTATIGGSAWAPTSVSAGAVSGIVEIISKISGGTSFQVVFAYTSPGTYQLYKSTNSYIAYVNGQTSTSYMSTSGSIVVTSYSNHVMIGTFQGYCLNLSTVTDSISVTNGKFNVYVN